MKIRHCRRVLLGKESAVVVRVWDRCSLFLCEYKLSPRCLERDFLVNLFYDEIFQERWVTNAMCSFQEH